MVHTQITFVQFAVGLFVSSLLLGIPSMVFGAESTPRCGLHLVSNDVELTSSRTANVSILKGSPLQITWKSTNAKIATFGTSQRSISLSGSETVTVTKDMTYHYYFKKGSKTARCSVAITVVEGSITLPKKLDGNSKGTFSGTVRGLDTVRVEIYEQKRNRLVFSSKAMRVKKQAWDITTNRTLPVGEYEIRLLGAGKASPVTVSTTTFSVGVKTIAKESGEGTLVVKAVPLLVGGQVKPGSTVGISFLQVINVSKVPITLTSLSLQQNGTAPVTVFRSVSVVDDRDSFRTVVEGTAARPLFVGSSAVIPTSLVLAPGQSKLLTVKLSVATDASMFLGRDIKLAIAGIETTATLAAALPIKGVTWVLTK